MAEVRSADAKVAAAIAASRLPIPSLSDHPGYAKLAGLNRALLAARQDRQNAIDLLVIEDEIARPQTSQKGPRVAMLRDRADTLRKATGAPKSEAPPSPEGLPTALVTALSLIAGDKIEPEADRPQRQKALRAELGVIDKALMTIGPLLDQIKSEQSLAIAEKLVPQHREILRSINEAATALTAAIEAERRLFAATLAAGFDGRPDVLPRPALDGASRLGTLSEHDSQISQFRRRLEALGVL